MVIDYSERRTVNKNRPKKQPVNVLGFFIVVGAIGIAFAGGILTGWLLFSPEKNTALNVAVPHAEKAPVSPTVSEAAKNQPVSPKAGEPPLTFYETLSKGNSNALIGSGINPRRPAEPAQPKPASAVPAAAAPVHPPVEEKKTAVQASVPPTVAPPSHKETPKPVSSDSVKDSVKKGAGKPGGFTVQVASYRDRKEAEATVSRIVEKGFAAYIVETKVPDRGVWYRVRIGKHLDQQTANDLAARAGKGALAIPE